VIRCLLMVSVPLAGCVNMSGLDGGSRYACAAPDGVACDSVSGTYANAVHHNLPSQRGAPSASAARDAAASAGSASAANGGVAPPRPVLAGPGPGPAHATTEGDAGALLRSPARVLRLWTKPWEDADGDLWDQGYVYVQVDGGRWQLDHVRQRIRDRHQPLRPPPSPAPGAAAPAAVPSAAAEPPADGLPPGSAASPFGNFPSFNRPMAVPGRQP
jgi:conjugal transfer pilus assembly protein TraV